MKRPLSGPKHRKTPKPDEHSLVALTVKIDSRTYVRLSIVRAKERKTAQEILTEALKAYLEKVGA